MVEAEADPEADGQQDTGHGQGRDPLVVAAGAPADGGGVGLGRLVGGGAGVAHQLLLQQVVTHWRPLALVAELFGERVPGTVEPALDGATGSRSCPATSSTESSAT